MRQSGAAGANVAGMPCSLQANLPSRRLCGQRLLRRRSVAGAGAEEGEVGVHAAVAGIGHGVGGHARHLQLRVAGAWQTGGGRIEYRWRNASQQVRCP